MSVQAPNEMESEDPRKLHTPRILRQGNSPQEGTWICVCSHRARGKFCSHCGRAKPMSL